MRYAICEVSSVGESFLLYRSIAGVVMFVPSMCRHIGFEERIHIDCYESISPFKVPHRVPLQAPLQLREHVSPIWWCDQQFGNVAMNGSAVTEVAFKQCQPC